MLCKNAIHQQQPILFLICESKRARFHNRYHFGVRFHYFLKLIETNYYHLSIALIFKFSGIFSIAYRNAVRGIMDLLLITYSNISLWFASLAAFNIQPYPF